MCILLQYMYEETEWYVKYVLYSLYNSWNI